ncbi:MAG: hypothetical protein NZ954_08690 [Thermofilaceae archaeon]|nr:hypothetical protein [Thermofilaceae archaeon]
MPPRKTPFSGKGPETFSKPGGYDASYRKPGIENIYKSRFPVKEAKPVVANFGYEEKRWRETLRVKRTGQDNSFPDVKYK